MRIRILTYNHHLTKKQKVLLENLAFTKNWDTELSKKVMYCLMRYSIFEW